VKTKDLASVGSVVFLSFVVKFIADYIISYFIVGFYGYFFSILIMAIINFLICYLFVKIYDFYKVDILFFKKYNKEKQINNDNNKIIELIKKWLKKIILFLFLSIKSPFIMVIYFRKGHFNGFRENQIKILTTISIIGSTIIWNTFIYMCFYIWKNSKHFKAALFIII
jgi:hypothetical protein